MFRRYFATALALALSSPALAQPLTTAFTFQGQLNTAGSPASGLYDARFRLYDAAAGGTQLGPTLCSDNLNLANGAFTTQLDFGAQFSGQQRFLEIDIRPDTGLNCSNSTGFTTLSPRQPLTAAPNAIYSLNATSAASATNATQLNGQPSSFYTNAANLSGPLPSASLAGAYSSTLNLSSTSNLFTGSFSGNGANLTGIPYAALTGAPTPVLLQASTPGSTQVGNLNINGTGRFMTAVSIATPHADLPLVVGGRARICDDGSDGDALHIGGLPSRAALTSEAGQNILNLDMNFHVTNANTGAPGAAVRVNGLGSGTAPIQLLVRAAGSTAENTALMVLESGQVGIGFYPQPGEQFSVASSGTAGAFYGTGPDCVTVNNYGAGRGIHVTTNSDTALWATTTSGFAAVDARSASGTAIYSQSSAGTAVLGSSSATTGLNYGTYGESNSTSGVGLGGYAWASTGITYGAYSRSVSPDGRGLMAEATSTIGANYGVIGAAYSAAGFGVYSNGRTGASGTKSFRIDHPDDPANKYLLHYSSESPEVINFYRGTITLNEQGEAEVPLPPYFAKINKDPSYQLTAIGAPMPLLHVSRKIDAAALAQGAKAAPQDPAPACSFHISGGAPNAEVCWRVEAVRNDRWVQSHGAPVEVEKQGIEKGTYQEPALYSQPPETGTFSRSPLQPPSSAPK